MSTDPANQTIKPCRWWRRWFCRSRLLPVYHSWQCETCGKVFYD